MQGMSPTHPPRSLTLPPRPQPGQWPRRINFLQQENPTELRTATPGHLQAHAGHWPWLWALGWFHPSTDPWNCSPGPKLRPQHSRQL